MTMFVPGNRLWTVTTPQGKDFFLLVGFSGQEGLSQLFQYRLELVLRNDRTVKFEDVLGQPVSVSIVLSNGQTRFFNGICSRIGQGTRDEDFTHYNLEVVPHFWLLTRQAQSRIFQQKSVPQILEEVLKGLTIDMQVRGTFHPRDYCVQYRETDFNFASRLMEEEGIYYYFKHTADGKNTLVLANTPASHPDLPIQSKAIFEPFTGGVVEDRVHSWHKVQELWTGKFTLFDHAFQKPHDHLAAEKELQASAQAGKVTHKLKVDAAAKLEVYDYPGEYAQRFDDVAPGGGDRSGDLQHLFTDNKRTVAIRAQEASAQTVVVHGSGNCRTFVSGHKFKLERHFDGDGEYVITGVQHSGRLPGDTATTAGGDLQAYYNTFTCIPAAIPYCPPRRAPKPFVQGTQTAVVVGPPGEEIFTDKYGRVKVQFHWDRQGKNDANSSCWVRVAQVWAGKRWGASFWPRIGQEVIVAFEEGDPDRPIIVGSVYNADQMPPYLGEGPDPKHNVDNRVAGIKSNSTPGGVGYNEWRFDDARGREQIFIHAERNMDQRIKNDSMELVLRDRHLIVGQEKDGKKIGDQKEKVFQDKHLLVHRHQVEQIAGNKELLVGPAEGKGNQDAGNLDVVVKMTKKELIEVDSHLHVKNNLHEQVDVNESHIVGGRQTELTKGDRHVRVNKHRVEQIDGTQSLTVGGELRESVGSNTHLKVKGNRMTEVEGNQSLKVKGKLQEKVGGNHALEAQEIHLTGAMKIIIEAGMQVSIKGPGGFIDIGPAGVTIQGIMVKINSGGAAGSGSGCSPDAPEAPLQVKEPVAPNDAKLARPAAPTLADDSKTGQKSAPG